MAHALKRWHGYSSQCLARTVCNVTGCGALVEKDGRCRAHRHATSGQWRKLVAATLKRDRTICWLCGLPGADTADHVLPRARGGRDELANLRAAHQRCNVSRGAGMKAA